MILLFITHLQILLTLQLHTQAKTEQIYHDRNIFLKTYVLMKIVTE